MSNLMIAGLWHQGSVLAACFADAGHKVCGLDSDLSIVANLREAVTPVVEPQLNDMVKRNIEAGRLRFETDYHSALTGAHFAYISIDTPVGPNEESDLSGIFDAAKRIARAASESLVIVVTAQVPVGTSDRIAQITQREVVYVPEFLRLGMAVESLRQTDRFVIGASNPETAHRVAELYRTWDRPMFFTDIRSAEMAKHASNAFLAASISFINEIADLCEHVDADALHVAEIMKLDHRIGPAAFLSAGLGFAGGTLGRDVHALQAIGKETETATPLMAAVMEINRARPRMVVNRLRSMFPTLNGLNVGIWGLTYKAGTSTLRRSVAIEVIRELVSQGANIKTFDPLANLSEVSDLPPLEACKDAYAAAAESDVVILLTEFAGILDIDFSRIRSIMRTPILFDTRNIFTPEQVRSAGMTYIIWGRRSNQP